MYQCAAALKNQFLGLGIRFQNIKIQPAHESFVPLIFVCTFTETYCNRYTYIYKTVMYLHFAMRRRCALC